MPEHDVSQGAGKVPCDTNEGLELGGGTVDRFDEMAREMTRTAHTHCAIPPGDPETCRDCGRNIREHFSVGETIEQRIAAALRETDAKAREEERAKWVLFDANAIFKTPAIREGADAPRGPIADEDGCCSSCGRGLVPCPACQGGDDAE